MPRKGRPRGFPRISLRNISRDEPEFFAWRVQIGRRRRRYHRHFPDGPDGPFESLRAAIVWRDETWARIGAPSKVRKYPRPTGSGMHGVVLEGHVNGSDRYVALWVETDGRKCRRSFSIDKYGKAEAFRLATAARLAGVAATEKERYRRMLDTLHANQRILRSKG